MTIAAESPSPMVALHVALRCPPTVRFLWFVLALLLPYYGGASGNLQITDIVLALLVGRLAVARMFGPRIGGVGDRLVLRLSAYVGWVVLVNVGWYTVGGNTELLYSSAFAAHGLILFGALVISGQWFGGGVRSALTWGLVVAMFWQLAVVATTTTAEGSRPVGTFNSPNQLGYFALLVVVACLLTVAGRTPGRLRIAAYLAIPIALFLIVVSGTRAAIVGVAMLALSAAVRAGIRPVLLVPLAVAAAVLVMPAADVAHEVMNRPAGTEDDGAGARGYDRLTNYPQWPLTVGAGEGDYGRHESDAGTHEIHSGVATIVFSYGIPGVVLFLRFLWPYGRRALRNGNVYLLALVGYNLFHQGLRFRGLWVVMGLAALLAIESAHRTPEASRDPIGAPA